jgi:hypothetical protein
MFCFLNINLFSFAGVEEYGFISGSILVHKYGSFFGRGCGEFQIFHRKDQNLSWVLQISGISKLVSYCGKDCGEYYHFLFL